MAIAPARRVALDMVGECRRRSARMRDLLRGSDELTVLEARDRALAFRLCLGVAAAGGQLDQLINAHLRKPRSLEPRVRDALRVAAYELCWLQTLERAAVSQGVELVRSVSPHAAGLANAVLRRLAEQDRPRVRAALERCRAGAADEGDLALAQAVPAWLVGQLVVSRGLEGTRALLASRLDAAPTVVAVNRALHAGDEACALLADAGLDPRASALPGSFVLGSPAGLAASGLVDRTDVVVADVAAQVVAQLCAPVPGSHVLEIGQGRGTKTILLESSAVTHGGPCRVHALDSEPFKVRVATARMERAGLSSYVTCRALDGCRLGAPDLPEGFGEAFDLVFLDAPCSGVGTMRRHVEIAWELGPDAVDPARDDSLPSLQLQLLRAAAARVAIGGTLCYSTCSALVQEDEQVVQAFLASPEGEDFHLVPATSRLAEAPEDQQLLKLARPWTTDDGYLLTGLRPSELGVADTHFLALMHRG